MNDLMNRSHAEQYGNKMLIPNYATCTLPMVPKVPESISHLR